jgi:hypothetical protein
MELSFFKFILVMFFSITVIASIVLCTMLYDIDNHEDTHKVIAEYYHCNVTSINKGLIDPHVDTMCSFSDSQMRASYLLAQSNVDSNGMKDSPDLFLACILFLLSFNYFDKIVDKILWGGMKHE